ncbi:hypothetical protein Dcar01_03843 [Deinococcus carri]|uniref:LigA n=1 Tax=Deinococcus carri TaxID=1211323 RepID=A0ABP9WG48_9DEIO
MSGWRRDDGPRHHGAGGRGAGEGRRHAAGRGLRHDRQPGPPGPRPGRDRHRRPHLRGQQRGRGRPEWGPPAAKRAAAPGRRLLLHQQPRSGCRRPERHAGGPAAAPGHAGRGAAGGGCGAWRLLHPHRRRNGDCRGRRHAGVERTRDGLRARAARARGLYSRLAGRPGGQSPVPPHRAELQPRHGDRRRPGRGRGRGTRGGRRAGPRPRPHPGAVRGLSGPGQPHARRPGQLRRREGGGQEGGRGACAHGPPRPAGTAPRRRGEPRHRHSHAGRGPDHPRARGEPAHRERDAGRRSCPGGRGRDGLPGERGQGAGHGAAGGELLRLGRLLRDDSRRPRGRGRDGRASGGRGRKPGELGGAGEAAAGGGWRDGPGERGQEVDCHHDAHRPRRHSQAGPHLHPAPDRTGQREHGHHR